MIKTRLVDLENKIEEMSKDGTGNKRLYDTVNTVQDISHYNKVDN